MVYWHRQHSYKSEKCKTIIIISCRVPIVTVVYSILIIIPNLNCYWLSNFSISITVIFITETITIGENYNKQTLGRFQTLPTTLLKLQY